MKEKELYRTARLNKLDEYKHLAALLVQVALQGDHGLDRLGSARCVSNP